MARNSVAASPSKVDLVAHLMTAKAIGLTVPPMLLATVGEEREFIMIIGGTAVGVAACGARAAAGEVTRIGTSSPWRCFGSGSPMRRSSAPISGSRCSGVEHPNIRKF